MKFLADSMLGRLAKWLRILGYDTLYGRNLADAAILKRAKLERRMILTRDHELHANAPPRRSLLVENEKYLKQVKEVIRKLRLKPSERRFFSLCLECNVPVRRVLKHTLARRVPAYLLNRQKFFWKCPKCLKIFWRASHYDNTLKQFRKTVTIIQKGQG